MMRNFFIICFVFFSVSVFSQIEQQSENSTFSADSSRVFNPGKNIKDIKPSIELYKIYTLQKDTTFIDTTLSIQKEYKYNLLRKDIFGLLPFSNEGQTYNTLDFSLHKQSSFPNFGFTAKHFNYLEVNDIKYYNVPTPLSDLYFKTVMEQGQSVDAFLTINTKPNLNFSIAYKGLRSNGKYINSITSSGNLRFTTSYFSKSKRYYLNAHFTGQDISNQENGGITDVTLFETSNPPYNKRERLDVYFRDATSFLKGNRFFIDHSYKLNGSSLNNLVVFHQFNQEYKFFEFTQPTVSTRFGNSYTNSINNKTRYNHLYNKLGVSFSPKNYGNLSVFVDANTYNYYYNSVVYDNVGNILVPNAINDKITGFGANYEFKYKSINFGVSSYNAITNQNISSIEAFAKFKLDSIAAFEFKYFKRNSLPNLNYSLYQSNYVDYNWVNNFKNEKRNQFEFSAKTKFLNLEAQYTFLEDYLYFENTTSDITQLTVKPFQYNKTITYLSVKASKEFKIGKFALDNTFLYQNVENSDKHLNVPEFVARNTLYYTDYVFKKAMQIQTGFTFQYFTKYYANDYNPLLGEFYVQNQTKIGDFPMVDFFINAKVKQVRIFLKAEHFNSSFTGYNFYSAPNYPYRDFLVRFGLVWNFFK
jgi:hypothetical protein